MLYPIELGVHRFFRASQVHLPSQIQERPERTMNTCFFAFRQQPPEFTRIKLKRKHVSNKKVNRACGRRVKVFAGLRIPSKRPRICQFVCFVGQVSSGWTTAQRLSIGRILRIVSRIAKPATKRSSEITSMILRWRFTASQSLAMSGG